MKFPTAVANKNLLNKLNKIVHGQEQAKKTLITVFNRAYLRHYQRNTLKLSLDECVTPRSLLLVGDSGTGKTFLVDTIAAILKFPIIKLTATDLAPTGCRDGITVDTIHNMIMTVASDFSEKFPERYLTPQDAADQTVVFIDEIDKLALSFDSSGNWNKNIQNTFLKFIENKDSFSSLSFIFAGAFTGMKKFLKNESSLGFHKNLHIEKEIDLEKELTTYGLTPEFVGRIQSIVCFDRLQYSDYEKILYHFILPQKEKELKSYGLSLDLSGKNYQKILKKTMESEQGVRFLVREIDKLIIELEYSLDLTADYGFLGKSL